MLDSVDLVMWTKNGSATLSKVLKRVSQTIPEDNINDRIMVDDKSNDETRNIGEAFGWKIIQNEGEGISDGANTALKNVHTQCFISIEQDLLLSLSWWNQIPPILGGRVAVASGMRSASQPQALRKLQLFVAKKYRVEPNLASYLRGREPLAFTLGKTLDNTIYRTDVIREMGGFPKVSTMAGVDTTLAYMLEKHGYVWKVEPTVQSTHLRRGIGDELRHQKWYGSQIHAINHMVEELSEKPTPFNFRVLVSRVCMSPATGVFLAWKTKEPLLALYHPLIKLYYLAGFLEGWANA